MAEQNDKMTFGGHLEELRQMLFRILFVVCGIAIVVFCMKDITWKVLLDPSECDFCTYKWVEWLAHKMGFTEFHFSYYSVELITTNLSSQFMLHITTAIYLGFLGASPFVMFELFRFISPALYESEKKYSVQIALTVYLLFIIGVLMTYYIIFPISFRFLGTYSVAEKVRSTITLDSYIDTFTTLSLVMGVVFQLPVISYILGKMGFINAALLSKYRKHSIVLIMLIAAIITPPDILTLIIVTVPLFLLYEISIWVLNHFT